jgi:hypothetical protein
MASSQEVATTHNLAKAKQKQFDYKGTTQSVASLRTFCSKASLALDVCEKVLSFLSSTKSMRSTGL